MSSTASSLQFSKHVLTSRSSHIGTFTLNKPSKLNALSIDMIRAMNSILPIWQQDPTLLATIVEGSYNEKTKKSVFCAGGDVKSIALSGLEKETFHQQGYGMKGNATADFFREEYELNYRMAIQQSHYNTHQVSLWDGIVMGGGVGISLHGNFRVATDNTLFAMPETKIGLFPDVGATYLFSRMELSEKFKGFGMFLALTGWKLRPDDLLFAEIATHYVPSSQLSDLKTNLYKRVQKSEDVKIILDEFHQCSTSSMTFTYSTCSFLEQNMEEIQYYFANTKDGSKNKSNEIEIITVPEILHNLSSSETQFAKTMLSHLNEMSPTSLIITNEGIRRSAQLDDMRDVLKMEYRMCQGCIRHCGTPSTPSIPSISSTDSDNTSNTSVDSDFYEGIRATLIDKDHKPKWNPNRVEDVNVQYVIDRYFNDGILRQELSLKSLVDDQTRPLSPSRL